MVYIYESDRHFYPKQRFYAVYPCIANLATRMSELVLNQDNKNYTENIFAQPSLQPIQSSCYSNSIHSHFIKLKKALTYKGDGVQRVVDVAAKGGFALVT